MTQFSEVVERRVLEFSPTMLMVFCMPNLLLCQVVLAVWHFQFPNINCGECGVYNLQHLRSKDLLCSTSERVEYSAPQEF